MFSTISYAMYHVHQRSGKIFEKPKHKQVPWFGSTIAWYLKGIRFGTIYISLCNLFNKSFQSSSLPSDWKIAHIIPVHEKRPRHRKKNYRQISLTSIISKNAEKTVTSRVVSFWTEHQWLNPSLFGNLEGRSIVSQLISCYNDWSLSRNSSKASNVIFLGLSKAFE